MRTQNTLDTFRIEFMRYIVVCLTASCYMVNHQNRYSGYHFIRNVRNYSWVGGLMKISNVMLIINMIIMLYYTITGAQFIAMVLILLIPVIMSIDN